MPRPGDFDGIALPGQAEFEATVDLEAGGNTETYVLPIVATIEGVVTDAYGRGVEEVHVRASLLDAGGDQDHDGLTVAGGSYRIECPPGDVRVRVTLGPDGADPDWTAPFPVDVRLSEGGGARIDFCLGGGSGRVVGRVVDQDGAPFPELPVSSYYSPAVAGPEARPFTWMDRAKETRTDANGEFALTNLPASRFGVVVAPDGHPPSSPVGERLLGMHVPTQYVDLRDGESIDLGTIVAHRSRPYRVEGRIVVGGHAAHPPGEPRLVVLLREGVRRQQPKEVPVKLVLEKDGTFSFRWACETPEESVSFQLHGPDGSVVLQDVYPRENVTDSITLQLD